MEEHELRRQIIEEMHLRRWPGIDAPCTIFQILRLLDPLEREDERDRLRNMLGLEAPPSPTARHLSGRLQSGLRVTWERHTEGSSVVVQISPGDDDEARTAAREAIESLPGKVLRATEILIVDDQDEAEKLLPDLGFSKNELVSARIGSGVRFWSDFRLHDHGYGRVLIAAGKADRATLARTIQQLQELGNYRNLALLGLPPVREQWSDLDALEEDLRRFASDVSDKQARDDRLLENVSDLSLHLANLTNAIGYRLDATKAYAELVSERLEDLAPERIEGFETLGDFTRRRLLPAVRTCAAHRVRLGQLSSRAADLTALLRARIETRIENQNARLLLSMERTGHRQMRLQQLVEGLSVFALAYYGVGLLGYVLRGLEPALPLPRVELLEAAAVPVFILLIWFAIRTVKKRILADDS